MRHAIHYALIFTLLTSITVSSFAQTPIVIKFSHDVLDTAPKGLAIQRFKEISEKLTLGRVRVDIYTDSKLIQDKDELEALQLGVIQMAAPALGKISALGLREFDVFDLPYLFPDSDALHRITQGPIGRELFKKLGTKSMVGLGYWDAGFKNIISNKPIHRPEDLRNLKVQGQPSKVVETQLTLLGAIPRFIPAADVRLSLRNGAIDAAESIPSSALENKKDQPPKYLSITGHGYVGYAIVVNKKFWDGLPTELRVQLTSAVKETGKFANQLAQETNDQSLASFKKSGKTTVIELTPAEKILWRKTLLPVQTAMEARIGQELINAINKSNQEDRTPLPP